MESIVIPVKDKEESRFLIELVTKLGYNPISTSAKNDSQFYKLLFGNVVKSARKKSGKKVSMKEIEKEVAAVRTKNYEARKK